MRRGWWGAAKALSSSSGSWPWSTGNSSPLGTRTRTYTRSVWCGNMHCTQRSRDLGGLSTGETLSACSLFLGGGAYTRVGRYSTLPEETGGASKFAPVLLERVCSSHASVFSLGDGWHNWRTRDNKRGQMGHTERDTFTDTIRSTTDHNP
eukprot:gene25114-biopygen4476